MKDDLLFLIENIPSVLNLYVPGIVSLLVYLFFNDRRLSTTAKTYTAVIASYVLCSLVELSAKLSGLEWMVASSWTTAAMATIIGVLIALLTSYVLHNKSAVKLSNEYLHRPLLSTWETMLNLEVGTTLAIYEVNRDYYVAGNFMLLDDSVRDPWIVLNGYKNTH